jgi:hypothetical protein
MEALRKADPQFPRSFYFKNTLRKLYYTDIYFYLDWIFETVRNSYNIG